MINSQNSETSGPHLLYSVKEVTQILGGISSKTVYRLVKRGLLHRHPAFRTILISWESLLEFQKLAKPISR